MLSCTIATALLVGCYCVVVTAQVAHHMNNNVQIQLDEELFDAFDMHQLQHYHNDETQQHQRLLQTTTESPPKNDDCEDATEITILPYPARGTTAASTPDFDSPSCGADGSANGVWYAFTPSTSGIYTASVNAGLGIRIYSGDGCDSLACVSQFNSQHTFIGVEGIDYKLLVSDDSLDSEGTSFVFILNSQDATPFPTLMPTGASEGGSGMPSGNSMPDITDEPTETPTETPISSEPSEKPTIKPTIISTPIGTNDPTAQPTSTLTDGTSTTPTQAPNSSEGTMNPTAGRTMRPTTKPTSGRTAKPTSGRTAKPTAKPITRKPTSTNTMEPTPKFFTPFPTTDQPSSSSIVAPKTASPVNTAPPIEEPPAITSSPTILLDPNCASSKSSKMYKYQTGSSMNYYNHPMQTKSGKLFKVNKTSPKCSSAKSVKGKASSSKPSVPSSSSSSSSKSGKGVKGKSSKNEYTSSDYDTNSILSVTELDRIQVASNGAGMIVERIRFLRLVLSTCILGFVLLS